MTTGGGGPGIFFFFVCLCLFSAFLVYACLFFFSFSNRSRTPALLCLSCHIMRKKANRQHGDIMVSGATDCTGLCDPLNCVEGGLRNNCCVTEAPSWAVCVKALREQSPSRLNLSFSPAAGSGIWQRVSGKGVSVLQPLGLLWAYIITSQRCSSGVVSPPPWRLLGGSPVASCGCSRHCGKFKCWSFPRGKFDHLTCFSVLLVKDVCLVFIVHWMTAVFCLGPSIMNRTPQPHKQDIMLEGFILLLTFTARF